MTKYRPSNGSEGADFMALFCDRCKRDEIFQRTQDGEDSCPIAAATMAYSTTDADYPPEWTYDPRGVPVCTAFEPLPAFARQVVTIGE